MFSRFFVIKFVSQHKHYLFVGSCTWNLTAILPRNQANCLHDWVCVNTPAIKINRKFGWSENDYYFLARCEHYDLQRYFETLKPSSWTILMKINCFNIHCSRTTEMREFRLCHFATLLKFLLHIRSQPTHIRSQPTPRSSTLIISMSSQQQWKAFTQQYSICLLNTITLFMLVCRFCVRFWSVLRCSC